MNKNLFFLITGLLFLGSTVFGQTIQNSVISSAGGSASSGNVKMDFTLGETVIETVSASGNTLTQGFHQTNLTLVAIVNIELFPEISVYPNPTTELVNLDIPANYSLLDIRMYDLNGKLLRTIANASGLVTFDVRDLAKGTYYLQVINPQNNELKTFRLIKS
ncbi:MAG: T9SS type A sorting domain-containing protein [Bacteroidales bacterium]|nr:T9SS type A sorting domain-containing protein [Bacteroidales bacterium]